MFLNIRLFIYTAIVGFALGLILPGELMAGTEIDIGLSESTGAKSEHKSYLGFKYEGDRFSASAQFRYGEREGDRTEEKVKIRAGYDPELNDTWSLWFFEELGKDYARKIQAENFVGAGPKYTFWKNKTTKASLSAGYLSHIVDYQNGHSQSLSRASLRPKVSWHQDRWDVGVMAFYRPNMNEFKKDYILGGEISWRYAITEKLGLKLQVEDSYRSVSVVEENNNLSTTLTISIRF